jgi:hypothetical protein
MSKLMITVLLLCAACPNQATHAASGLTDVDQIVARHIEARGGYEAIKGIHSLVFSAGQYAEPGYTSAGNSSMMLMRPYFKLVGNPADDPAYMEGYDGAAWEWFADPGLVVRTVGRASAAIRHMADVEGPLVDYAEKGHTLALIGTETIGDRPAYHLRLTMMDGFATDLFIDQGTFLIIASRMVASIHAFGAEVASESRVGDYREVAGVLFPHRFTETRIDTGEALSSMQWGSIQANTDIPVAWFSPPEFERTRIQTFMEQLFIQRSDVTAVLWTYHRFRRAYPDEDTRVASEIIGFQTLKMGDHDTAIALLERNAADHPNAADSAFGLGRAYATAGRPDDARAEFQRALDLEPGHPRATRALAALSEGG